jgi:glycosyltransferase involved in cell wall biosynthesis
VYNIKHSGPGSARNCGIKKAGGEYIFFCDTDDKLPLNALESLLNKAVNNNTDITIGDYKIVYDERHCEIFRTPPIKHSKFNAFFESVTVWNRLYLTSFIKKNKIFFSRIYQGEDRIFLARAYLKNPRINTLDEIVYIWQRHRKDKDKGKSLSQSGDLECFIGQINCMKEFVRILGEKGHKELDEHIKYSCKYLLDLYSNIDNRIEQKEAYPIFSDYLQNLEWEKNDSIYNEIFSEHTEFNNISKN